MYSIKIMNDQEFENLPYNNMGEKVGVCDRNRGEIYVRSSGVQALDTFNAIHEVEHMEEGDWGKHADHQDPELKGIYYKGFGDVIGTVSNIGSMIPGPWQIPAMIGSGLSAGGLLGDKQQAKAPDTTQMNQPMQAFQPSVQTPQSNVIQPTAGAGKAGGTAPMAGTSNQGPTLVERLRGFLSGRNPSQEFGKSSQSFGGF